MITVKVIQRREVKAAVADSKFWELFPEYRELHERILAKQLKQGCCGGIDELYATMLGYVKANPAKWKQYYGADKLQIFDRWLITL